MPRSQMASRKLEHAQQGATLGQQGMCHLALSFRLPEGGRVSGAVRQRLVHQVCAIACEASTGLSSHGALGDTTWPATSAPVCDHVVHWALSHSCGASTRVWSRGVLGNPAVCWQRVRLPTQATWETHGFVLLPVTERIS